MGAPVVNNEQGAGVNSPRQVPPPPGSRMDRHRPKQDGTQAPTRADTAARQNTEIEADVPQKKKRSWIKRLAVGLISTIAVLIIIGGALFLWAYSRATVPQPSEFALAQTTVVYYNDEDTELGRFSDVNRTIIDVASLPPYVTEAVIASEDRTFYTNAGVDLKGIVRAAINNLRGGARQGASTLSQQYVENYYLGNPTKSYADKMREALIALKINRSQTKEEILENYMNTIYFGRNAYGIEAASQAYFAKPATELTLSESAMLSGIIPAPSAWDPAENPQKAEERWARVLELMVEEEYITQAEASAQVFPETISPQDAQQSNQLTGWSGYLLQQIRQELLNSGSFTEEEINAGGLKIISTLDVAQQQAAVEAVAILPEDTPDSVHVALSSVDNETGEIVAEYAGDDYAERQINSVTQETAMAGSTLKPFALIPFVRDGGSIWDTFNANSPQDFQGISVQNVDNISFGQISAAQATGVSANTAFVAINEIIGPQIFMDTVIEAGLPEDTQGLEPTLLNVLGFASPRNIDLAKAFATLANGGERVEPHIVRAVKDARGNDVYQGPTTRERVFDSDTISKIMPALEAPAKQGGSAAKVSALGHPVGGKTGTSEETKSALFAGFTPQYTTVVSMFNVGEGGAMLPLPPIGNVWSVHGGDWPTDIWLAYMYMALEGIAPGTFSWYDTSAVEQVPVIPDPTPQPEPEPEPSPEPDPTPTPDPAPQPEPEPEPSPEPDPGPEPEPEPDPDPGT